MPEEIIAVMGATGAGKSSFIKMVTEDEGVVVGHSLISETQAIIPYPWQFAGRNIVFVDTPGFDDTYTSDGDILQSLVEWLARTYQNGTKLSGIIYLHRITDVRMQGSAMRNLRVFRELCGPGFFPHVTLCASFWSTSPYKQKEQNQRLYELTNEGGYWSSMIAAGSTVFSERLTRQSGIQMIFKLLHNGERTMQIQREVVDEHRPIQECSAVATLMSIQLERLDGEHQEKLAELRQQLENTMSARERTHSENLESMRQAYEARLAASEAMNTIVRTEIENLQYSTHPWPLVQQPSVSPTFAPTPLPPRRPISNARWGNPSVPATPTQPQALEVLGVLVISTVCGEIHLAIQTMADRNAKTYTRRDQGVRGVNASRDRKSISAETTVNTVVWTHFANRVASGRYNKTKICHKLDTTAPEDIVLWFLPTFAQAWTDGDRAVSVNLQTWRFELRETLPKVFAIGGEVVKGKNVLELVRTLKSTKIAVSKWEIRKP